MKALAYPLLGSIGALVLDGTTMLPLGAAIGVMFFVFRVSSRWTELTLEVQTMREEIRALRVELGEIKKRLETK